MPTFQDLLMLWETAPAFSVPEEEGGQTFGDSQHIVGGEVEAEIVKQLGLDVIGEYEDSSIEIFSTYHHKQRIIKDPSRIDYSKLLQLAGPAVKQHVAKPGEEDTPAGLSTVWEVRDAIAFLAGHSPINESSKLGIGCWQGKDKAQQEVEQVVLVGCGEAALWDGETLHRINHPRCGGQLLDFGDGDRNTPWVDFNKLEEYLHLAESVEWRKVQFDKLYEILRRWVWRRNNIDPYVAAGLLVAGWVQTLWKWRPQVALMGGSNTGKSMMFEAMKQFYHNITADSAGSTAAGIRQTVRSSSRMIICDEFENTRHRVETMEMLRNAGRGSSTFRGSANQKKQEFSLRHIAWVAAIEVNFKREPDKNRFIQFELKRPATDDEGKLVAPSSEETRDLGIRLLSCAVRCIFQAKAIAHQLHTHKVGTKIASRVLESYSVPAAMIAALCGMDMDGAKSVFTEMLIGGVTEHDDEKTDSPDEELLLEEILGRHVHNGRETRSVAQLIHQILHAKDDANNAGETLAKVGVKWDEFSWKDADNAEYPEQIKKGKACLVINPSAVSSHLLRGTQWEGQSIQKILRRLPATIKRQRRIGGTIAWCLLISVDIVSKFLADIPGRFLGRTDEYEDVFANPTDSREAAGSDPTGPDAHGDAYEPETTPDKASGVHASNGHHQPEPVIEIDPATNKPATTLW